MHVVLQSIEYTNFCELAPPRDLSRSSRWSWNSGVFKGTIGPWPPWPKKKFRHSKTIGKLGLGSPPCVRISGQRKFAPPLMKSWIRHCRGVFNWRVIWIGRITYIVMVNSVYAIINFSFETLISVITCMRIATRTLESHAENTYRISYACWTTQVMETWRFCVGNSNRVVLTVKSNERIIFWSFIAYYQSLKKVYSFIEITSDIPHMFTIKVQVIRNTAHRPSTQASYTIGSGTTTQEN